MAEGRPRPTSSGSARTSKSSSASTCWRRSGDARGGARQPARFRGLRAKRGETRLPQRRRASGRDGRARHTGNSRAPRPPQPAGRDNRGVPRARSCPATPAAPRLSTRRIVGIDLAGANSRPVPKALEPLLGPAYLSNGGSEVPSLIRSKGRQGDREARWSEGAFSPRGPRRTKTDRVGPARAHDLEVGHRMGPPSERLAAASGDGDDDRSSRLTTGIEKGARTHWSLLQNFSGQTGPIRARPFLMVRDARRRSAGGSEGAPVVSLVLAGEPERSPGVDAISTEIPIAQLRSGRRGRRAERRGARFRGRNPASTGRSGSGPRGRVTTASFGTSLAQASEPMRAVSGSTKRGPAVNRRWPLVGGRSRPGPASSWKGSHRPPRGARHLEGELPWQQPAFRSCSS
jgi:hypothetical protein